MARAGSADLPDGESEIFFARGLDRFSVICPTGCFFARRATSFVIPGSRQEARPGMTESFNRSQKFLGLRACRKTTEFTIVGIILR
jgi:hypothetical protein